MWFVDHAGRYSAASDAAAAPDAAAAQHGRVWMARDWHTTELASHVRNGEHNPRCARSLHDARPASRDCCAQARHTPRAMQRRAAISNNHVLPRQHNAGLCALLVLTTVCTPVSCHSSSCRRLVYEMLGGRHGCVRAGPRMQQLLAEGGVTSPHACCVRHRVAQLPCVLFAHQPCCAAGMALLCGTCSRRLAVARAELRRSVVSPRLTPRAYRRPHHCAVSGRRRAAAVATLAAAPMTA